MEYQEWIRVREMVSERIDELKMLKARFCLDEKKKKHFEKLLDHNKDIQKYLDFVGQHWLKQ